MQRYFVQNHQIEEPFVFIDGDDFYHITRVMRMEIGDSFIIVLPNGRSALCQITNISNENVQVSIVKWEDEKKELPISVSIASGLPKGDKFEFIIQKGTELGAQGFIPFMATRSIVKWDEKKIDKRIERWTKIAKEAAEQSHRTFIPSIKKPLSIDELIEISKDFSHKAVAYEEEAKAGEVSQFSKLLTSMETGDSLLFVFGPEGGLTEIEISMLKEHGFYICGLSPRIMRAETAPLYVLSAVSYHFELSR